MLKLKSQKLPHITENVLKALAQNRIITLLDFLQEDVTRLAAITKLCLPNILAIRSEIFLNYSAPLVSGISLLKKSLETRRRLCTGIEGLDVITEGGIPVGYITEVCGLAGSGKTQLSLQLAINCVKNSVDTMLYIDTKGDFSAVRIQKILDTFGCTHREMAEIMLKINVVHVWTMEELVELFKNIKNKTLVFENLSLIIVDSLPCLMLQYLGDENKMGLSLLNNLVNYSRFIANEYLVGIIYINIQTRWIDPDTCDEDDGEGMAFKESGYTEKRNRCLGKYWNQIPTLVLLLERLEVNSKETHDSTKVKVSVMDSNNIVNDVECILDISCSGIK